MSLKQYWEQRIKKEGRFRSIGNIYYTDELNECIKNKNLLNLDHFFLSNLSSSIILDTGCGTGVFLEYFINKNARVVAIDFSETAIRYVHKKFPKTNAIISDVSYLPFKKNRFDMIICMSVLYHIIDDKRWGKALEDISNLLRVNGLLALQIEWVNAPTNGDYYKARSKNEYLRKFKYVRLRLLKLQNTINLSNFGQLMYSMGRKRIPHFTTRFIIKFNLFSKTQANVLLLLKKI